MHREFVERVNHIYNQFNTNNNATLKKYHNNNQIKPYNSGLQL